MYNQILDTEFDVDQLVDITTSVCLVVSVVSFTLENVATFDEHDDEIQDFLSDWYYDCIGGDEGSFALLCT